MAVMQFRKIGKSELTVSVVGLGTWAMGNDFFGFGDDSASIRAIRTAIDGGINLIDTAPAYGTGHAEDVVGEAIKGRRDSIVLATKVGTTRDGPAFVRDLTPETIFHEIDDSLARLDAEVIDLYQIHWPDPATPIEDSLDALEKVHQAGKYRYLGVSNFDVDLIEEVRRRIPVVSVQPHVSMLERSVLQNVLPYCEREEIGVLGYGSLSGGLLTGKFRKLPVFEKSDRRARFYSHFSGERWEQVQRFLDVVREVAAVRGVPAAHVAINWSIAQPGVTSALVGARNEDQARINAEAGEWSLSTEELKRLDEAYDRYCHPEKEE